jgi:hypothetical protein
MRGRHWRADHGGHDVEVGGERFKSFQSCLKVGHGAPRRSYRTGQATPLVYVTVNIVIG